MNRFSPEENIYDVIVVGGGHAGIEAALAAARMGAQTLLLTHNLDTIGAMSCNPAVGGLGKGQLVKEIDALGGEMGRAADETALQYRRLNASRGPAVRATRAQVDRHRYARRMKSRLERTENLRIFQGAAARLIVKRKKAAGIETVWGQPLRAGAVVLTPGTFLNGLILLGRKSLPGGRMGDPPSGGLTEQLAGLGLRTARFKTGTCPRLDGGTIDYSRLELQPGDPAVEPFSSASAPFEGEQLPCHLTWTNRKVHELIRENLADSPLFAEGEMTRGVRYCPLIEEKIVRFPEKERHHIFLEPEGRDTVEVYPNGIFTGLPPAVQAAMVNLIPGLEKAAILRPGYGIEYDCFDPTQLKPSLETRAIPGLFLAGQINGTTGYEEAAAQGLIAGANAARTASGGEPFTLGREEAFIGVMIDDLVTRGTNEPYRVFTSRAEYRLLLREDNAELRLSERAAAAGLIDASRRDRVRRLREEIGKTAARLDSDRLAATPENKRRLRRLGIAPIDRSVTLKNLLRRPEVSFAALVKLRPDLKGVSFKAAEQMEIDVKYEGFLERQRREADRHRQLDEVRIPPGFKYLSLPGLSLEAQEKLQSIRPETVGRASRIPGITPAAVSVLMVHLRRNGKRASSPDERLSGSSPRRDKR